MKAVVLAAGEGTRLRLLTEDKPRGMVEIDGKPLTGRTRRGATGGENGAVSNYS